MEIHNDIIRMALDITSEFGSKKQCNLSFSYLKGSGVNSVGFVPIEGRSPAIFIETLGASINIKLQDTTYSDKEVIEGLGQRNITPTAFKDLFKELQKKWRA